MRRLAAGVGTLDFPFTDGSGFWRWVDLCEAEGADSLWQSDRMIGDKPVLECMSALAAIAGRTKRIKFGMNALSAAMRDPVLAAKQCATIDVLSEGRLLPVFGIGAGDSPSWQALGLDFAGRGRRTDEALQIISRLWAGDSVDFAGAHFHLRGVAIRPKPVQRRLPMWIGGISPAAIRRAARFGTGWQGGLQTPQEVRPVIAAIAEAARAAGRPIDEDHYGTTVLFRFGHSDNTATQRLGPALQTRFGRDLLGMAARGDASDILGHLKAYVAAGISKFVMIPIAVDERDVLEQTAAFLKEVAPNIPGLIA